MERLILGSTSSYRRALMERLRIPFATEAPHVNEDEVKQSEDNPMAVVKELASRKAQAVFDKHPDAIVIGSDQAVCLGTRLLDKPGNAFNACIQLRELSGQEHQLLTAVAIAHAGGLVEFVDITRLVMRELTDSQIERYVQADEPFQCAGSYKIEGLGVTLFERIDGRDHTAIIGLPLLQLCNELRQIGVELP